MGISRKAAGEFKSCFRFVHRQRTLDLYPKRDLSQAWISCAFFASAYVLLVSVAQSDALLVYDKTQIFASRRIRMPSEETTKETILVGKRIVIVEDEGMTQMQLRKMLAHAGLNVVGSATNGKEGVEVILREQPDLVLMDINMPQMNGLEATKIVMETHKTCIVILTAYSDESHRQQAEEAGARGYLLKPITSDS